MTKKDSSIDEIVKSYKKKLNKIKEEGNYNKIIKFIDLILSGLELQLSITTKNLKNLPKDDFVLGYIWGFTDYLFQHSIGKDLDYWNVVSHQIYDEIYGSKISNLILQKIRFFNSNKQFIEGRESGALDSYESTIEAKAFLRLAEYLNNQK
jgi:hypothetical protein